MSLCIVSLVLFSSGCATKVEKQIEYVFYIPEKLSAPTKPTLLKYNTNQGLDSPENFKKSQQNTVFLIDYANALKNTVTQYETLIDEYQTQKKQLESK